NEEMLKEHIVVCVSVMKRLTFSRCTLTAQLEGEYARNFVSIRAKVRNALRSSSFRMSRRTGIALGLTGTHGERNRDVRKPRSPIVKDAGYVPRPRDVHIDPNPVPFTMVTPEDIDWANLPLRTRRHEPGNKPLGSGRVTHPLPRSMEWKWDKDLGYI